MYKCLFIAVFFASTLTLPAESQSGPKDAVVLVIRHAEDADSGNGISPLGEKRAEAYENYFLKFAVDSRRLEPTSFLRLKTQKKVTDHV